MPVDDGAAASANRATIAVMDPRLAAIAQQQHGVLSVHDAGRLELDADALTAMVRGRELVRVRRGAYVVAEVWAEARPGRRLALRTRSILHVRGAGAATHQSALAVHGVALHGLPLDVVDISGAASRSRVATGLRVHPTGVAPLTVDVDGCRCVPVSTALAQVGLRHGRDALVVATDDALHRGVVDLDTVAEEVHRLGRTRRQVLRAERWLAMTDAASESPGETRSRLLLTDLGWAVRSQERIRDGDEVVARVDLLVGDRVVVEFDGLVKYEGADGRAALAAEKRREDRLRALGYEVVRLTWADLDRPAKVAAMVRAAEVRAAQRRSRLLRSTTSPP